MQPPSLQRPASSASELTSPLPSLARAADAIPVKQGRRDLRLRITAVMTEASGFCQEGRAGRD